METIQDRLREEARDYQELGAMCYVAMWREWLDYRASQAEICTIQRHRARLYRIARSALFELIGAHPEHWDEAWPDL